MSAQFELPNIHRAVTVLDVVEAIEGPMKLNCCLKLKGCLNSERSCTRQEWCPSHDIWVNAQTAVAHVLRTANIADLARQSALRRPDNPVVTPTWN